MADIVRVFMGEHQKPKAMDENGTVFEITNMFMAGTGTNDLEEAESVVVKLDENHWLTLDVSDKTPWSKGLN